MGFFVELSQHEDLFPKDSTTRNFWFVTLRKQRIHVGSLQWLSSLSSAFPPQSPFGPTEVLPGFLCLMCSKIYFHSGFLFLVFPPCYFFLAYILRLRWGNKAVVLLDSIHLAWNSLRPTCTMKPLLFCNVTFKAWVKCSSGCNYMASHLLEHLTVLEHVLLYVKAPFPFLFFMVYSRCTSLVVDLETVTFLFNASFVFSVHCSKFTCYSPWMLLSVRFFPKQLL